jgi:hypothetical protein
MILGGIIDWTNDRLNPIVVKELRQAVQSRFIVALLCLSLGIQLLTLGIYLASNSDVRWVASVDSQAGLTLFQILHGVMLATCILFLPLYTGIRLAAERSDTYVDLLFVTTLKPRAIVGGKLTAALLLGMIIFSACAPFLVFTYLLRGIDWQSIVFAVAVDFVAVALAVMVAIFLAVIPAHWFFRALLGLFGFFGFLLILYMALAPIVALYFFGGGGAQMETLNFWGVTTCALTAVVGFGALLYSWSAAILSPPAANRALLWRGMFVVVWAVSLAIAWAWNTWLPDANNGPLVAWGMFASIMAYLGMIVAVNERESWSPRVSKTIPRRWWLRIGAFLFYSGAAGGLLFSILLFGLTLLVVLLGWSWFPAARLDLLEEGIRPFLVGGLYVLSYALTALLVRRLFSRRIPAMFTWVVMAALVVVGCVVPLTIGYMLYYTDWNYQVHYRWFVTDPFVAFVEAIDSRSRFWTFFLMASLIWAAVAALLNLGWFWRQVRAFRPYVSTGRMQIVDGRLLEVTPAQAATTKTV